LPDLQRQPIPFIDETEPLKGFPFISIVFLAAGIRAKPLGAALWDKSLEAYRASNSGFFWLVCLVFSTPFDSFRSTQFYSFTIRREIFTRFSSNRMCIKFHQGKFHAELTLIIAKNRTTIEQILTSIVSTSWRAL
jgi:hypothetical protein